MCFNYFCIGLPSAETQIVGLPCFFYFKSPDLLLKPNRIFTAFTLFRFSETSYLYTANNSKQNLFFSCLNAYAHCYCILNFALNRFISTTLGFSGQSRFTFEICNLPAFQKPEILRVQMSESPSLLCRLPYLLFFDRSEATADTSQFDLSALIFPSEKTC